MSSEELKQLRELEKAATPGPWRADNHGGGYLTVHRDTADLPEHNEVASASNRWEPPHFLATGPKSVENLSEENTLLLVALRNSAPALLDAAEEAEKLRDELTAEQNRGNQASQAWAEEAASLRAQLAESRAAVEVLRDALNLYDVFMPEWARFVERRKYVLTTLPASSKAYAERVAALTRVAEMAACPDCGGRTPRERNGGPCAYVFHAAVAALAALPPEKEPAR